MRYVDYLRLDGACSAGLGGALVVLGWPGLFGDGRLATAVPWAIAAVVVTIVLLAGFAARRGLPLGEPGRWLTERSVGAAEPGRTPLEAAALRRRLILETALWIVGVGAWVLLTGRDTTLIWATGWATAAYGLLQLLGSARRVRRLEAEGRGPFLVARRPGLGTPDLTT
jgi:hypothetical protein